MSEMILKKARHRIVNVADGDNMGLDINVKPSLSGDTRTKRKFTATYAGTNFEIQRPCKLKFYILTPQNTTRKVYSSYPL